MQRQWARYCDYWIVTKLEVVICILLHQFKHCFNWNLYCSSVIYLVFMRNYCNYNFIGVWRVVVAWSMLVTFFCMFAWVRWVDRDRTPLSLAAFLIEWKTGKGNHPLIYLTQLLTYFTVHDALKSYFHSVHFGTIYMNSVRWT